MATTEFRDAAAAQTHSLGFEAAVVWVDHPVQNRTAEELVDLARSAVPGIIAALTDTPAGG